LVDEKVLPQNIDSCAKLSLQMIGRGIDLWFRFGPKEATGIGML
jgi:hypothetical protein